MLHHITVPRTARYATRGILNDQTTQVWFCCHGYAQLAERFSTYLEGLDDGARYIVVPEGLSRFYVAGTHGKIGASWMTRDDREAEIQDYIHYLDTLAGAILASVDRKRITVHGLGFSQGVATMCRWALRGKTSLDHLVLWAEFLPPEYTEREAVSRVAAIPVTSVCGDQDEYISPATFHAQTERLAALGLRVQSVVFPGGHRLHKETLATVAKTWNARGPDRHGGASSGHTEPRRSAHRVYSSVVTPPSRSSALAK